MTNREAFHFINVLLYMKPKPNTKLEHARNQTLKNAAAFIEAYNEKIESLNIDFCSTDERGNILKGENNQYLFTKEAQRSLSKELKTFLDSPLLSPLEISPTSDVRGMSMIEIEYLSSVGFVKDSK
jgi:hypothetical protein